MDQRRHVLGFLSKRSHSHVLGIDISSTTIKLIELSRSSEHYRIDAFAVVALPQDAVVEKTIANVEEVAAALRLAVAQAKTKTTLTCTAVPGSAVMSRTVPMPAGLGEDDLETQLTLEADQYVPYPLDEVAIDFDVQGETANNPHQIDVLVAACRRESVDAQVEALELAGLTPKIVDVEGYALERVFKLMRVHHGISHDVIVAIADIGATVTTLSVFQEGRIIYTRDQLFGGKQLTDEIMRRYGLSLSEVSRAARKGDVSKDYESDVLRPFLNGVAQQVARSLQFFFSSSDFNGVDSVILAGGVAAIEGLEDFVRKRLNTKVVVADPLAGMTTATAVNSIALDADAPAMMVAIGLALRSFD